MAGSLSFKISHRGPGPLGSTDPEVPGCPTRSRQGREGKDWPRNSSGRSRLLVYNSRLRFRQAPASPQPLHPGRPELGPDRVGSGLSQHLGKTPARAPLLSFWKGTYVPGVSAPWVASLHFPRTDRSLLGTGLHSAEGCLGASHREDGGGPKLATRDLKLRLPRCPLVMTDSLGIV